MVTSVHSRSVVPPAVTYPIPRLTFGAEFEMCFVIRREIFWAWMKQPDPRPAELTLIDLHRTDPDRIARQAARQERQRQREDDYSKESSRSSRSGTSSPRSSIDTSEPFTMSSTNLMMRENVRQYIVDFLNSNIETSPLGLINLISAGKNPTEYTVWTLTEDSTVVPQRYQWAQKVGTTIDAIKSIFVVGGGELISPVLQFYGDSWPLQIDHIFKSLDYDGNLGVWLSGYEGLHVHLAIRDDGLTLEIVKNVIALYGLFEREIEQWVEVDRRENDSNWCHSVRKGMETRIVSISRPEIDTTRNRGHKYTPQEFTERIYSAPSLKHLKREVWGELFASDPRAIDSISDGGFEEMKLVTVNISLVRGRSKPTTLEFRQHEGTIDPVVIRWWILFLGHILNYAATLAAASHRLLDAEELGQKNQFSFLDGFTKESILEVLQFPDEGKAHFRKRARELRNEAWDARRALEQEVIEERIKRRRPRQVIGRWEQQQTGRCMDAEIKAELWYRKARDEVQKKYNIRIPLVEEDDEDSDRNSNMDSSDENQCESGDGRKRITS